MLQVPTAEGGIVALIFVFVVPAKPLHREGKAVFVPPFRHEIHVVVRGDEHIRESRRLESLRYTAGRATSAVNGQLVDGLGEATLARIAVAKQNPARPMPRSMAVAGSGTPVRVKS